MNKFNLSGAVDLAALAAAKSQADEPKTKSPFILDITDQDFQELVTEVSSRVPVILDLWATWCQPCKQLSPVLEKLAIEGNGTWVLAKVDVDANPRISQTFQVQSIPSVFLIMAERIQPLFTGVQPESVLRDVIKQLLEYAKQANLPGLGIAQSESAEDEAEEIIDEAEDALLSGDLDAAEKIYRERLAANPSDGDSKSAIALIELQRRTQGIDINQVSLPEVDNVAARLIFADSQILQGNSQLAYQTLIETIRAVAGAERDLVKQRLLALFEISDPADPIVLAARRELANALY
jgi:putative thioredoxin